MKCFYFNIALFFFVVSVFGQTSVFNKYDFNRGGYSLLGKFSQSDRNSFRDSLGEFYTDDTVVLNMFKNDWVFDKPGMQYACGYHYIVLVCKEGKALESFYVNLNCKEISSNYGYFYFDPDKLKKFYRKLKKPNKRSRSFTSLSDARLYWDSIQASSKLIVAEKPNWVEFEGSFSFEYQCPEGTKETIEKEYLLLDSIDAQMRKNYPNEKFELRHKGGSSASVLCELYCNKSLFENFSVLGSMPGDAISDWSEFSLFLTSYWK